jgi:UMF1 family MFS transporter
VAGILLLLLTILPVQRASGSTDALRFAIGGSGVWWALFSMLALLLLPGSSASDDAQNAIVTEEHEGLLASDPSSDAAPGVVAAEWSVKEEVVDAWRILGSMLRWQNIRRLRNTFRYLAAWFLLSDGMLPLHGSACYTEYLFSRFHNTNLDGAPFRKDNAPYATHLTYTRGCDHT